MSWLARSIANTLSLNDSDDEEEIDSFETKPKPSSDEPKNNDTSTSSPRGVKEDLSELTKTLTSQFWGVASFLAPPPQTEPFKPINHSDDGNSRESSDSNESEPVKNVEGIRNDFAEIGGKFKSGISKLSNNINVSEITKMASHFLQLGSDEEEGNASSWANGVVGLTEQSIAFAKDLALHPETWLDFPLPENELEEEFDMSDAQQEHALAVERIAPELSALRLELCPEYMSESYFWKIYFVLLHPTLDEQDAELLSTPQVVEARALLAVELQNRTKSEVDNKSGEVGVDFKGNHGVQHEESLSVTSVSPSNDASQMLLVPEIAPSAVAAASSEDVPGKIVIREPATSPVAADSSKDVSEETSIPKSAKSTLTADSETDKHPIATSESPVIDKSVIDVEHIKSPNVHPGPSYTWENKDEDDGDDWLKEESSDEGGVSRAPNAVEDEEDVSFSDLEEEDEDAPISSKTVNYTSDKDSREWVQL